MQRQNLIRLTFLKASYPFEQSPAEKRNTIFTMAVVGSLLLFVLQPYGYRIADQVQHFLALFLIGVLSAAINYFSLPELFPRLFDEKKWSVIRAFLFLAFNFLTIGLWSHLYGVLFIKQNIFLMASGPELLESLVKIMVIGLTAAAFFILFRYNIMARRHLQISQELNLNRPGTIEGGVTDQSPELTLLLEGRAVRVHRHTLTHVSAEGNYIALHLKHEDKATSTLYRATLKEIEEQLETYAEFFRCHRSFIINLNAIESTQGNSQGLFVRIDEEGRRVPVARPRIKELREHLTQGTN